jgi:hypothetical protein
MKIFSLILILSLGASFAEEAMKNLEPKNLVAWCIVPFDAKKRNPAERATMLKELGIGRCAYDWRNEHVVEFEEEILEYKKHGIEYFAFWGGHKSALALFEKHGLHPQIWQTAPSPKDGTQEEKVPQSSVANWVSTIMAVGVGSPRISSRCAKGCAPSVTSTLASFTTGTTATDISTIGKNLSR